MMRRAEEIAGTLSPTRRADLAKMLRMVISRIEARSDLMSITIQRSGLLALLRGANAANQPVPTGVTIEDGTPIVLTIPLARWRGGRDPGLLIDAPVARQPDPASCRC